MITEAEEVEAYIVEDDTTTDAGQYLCNQGHVSVLCDITVSSNNAEPQKILYSTLEYLITVDKYG